MHTRMWTLALVLAASCHAQAGAPEQVSLQKIWDQGRHNAFTDLIRFRGRFFCSFREADDHVGGDGKIRILVSRDGEKWDSAALLVEDGIDLRDPKLSITADKRLMVVAGGSVYQGGKKLLGRRPRVAFSRDGSQWTPPQKVLSDGEWLWRVTWHQGKAWGVSYNAMVPDGQDWTLKLVSAPDGVQFSDVAHLKVPGRPNETTLRFLRDGTLMALVRREGTPQLRPMAWIGTSPAPYTEWTWKESNMQAGGPNFIELPNGELWAVTRDYRKGPKRVTSLCRMDRQSLTPLLSFPSGGDNSYGGLLWFKNLLWVSYYSGHEGKVSIYLAKVRLPKAK